MSIKNIFMAGVAALLASGTARAESFSVADFSAAIAGGELTAVGDAVGAGTALSINNPAANAAGAAWASNAFAIGAGASLETTFNFSIGGYPGSGGSGAGFAFFMSSTLPDGKVGNEGLTGSNGIAVEFRTSSSSGPGGSGDGSSNFVTIMENGDSSQHVGALNPYGVTTCNGSGTAPNGTPNHTPGCLSNGGAQHSNLWTAHISLENGLLTVTLCDPSIQTGGKTCASVGALTTSLSYTVGDLAGLVGSNSIYFGFGGATGPIRYDSPYVYNWQLDVPEPAELAMFGVGLAALGFARGRRRAV